MAFSAVIIDQRPASSGFEFVVMFEDDADPRLNFQQCFVGVDKDAITAAVKARASQAALSVVGESIDLSVDLTAQPVDTVRQPTALELALIDVRAYQRQQNQQAQWDALTPDLQKQVTPGDL